MTAKQIIFIVTTTLLLSTGVCAQGEFLQPGENGFGVSFLKSFGNGTQGFGASFGYSIKGHVDLGFSFTKNTDSDMQAYSPHITGYMKGVHSKGMIGTGLTVGYVRTQSTRSSWYYSSYDADNLMIGFVLFNNFYLSEDVMLQLAASGYVWVVMAGAGDQTGAGSFGATLVFARSKPFRPFINVGFTIPEEDSYPSVSAGFVAVW